MKLHIDNEWARRTIATDPDADVAAGDPRAHFEVSAFNEATNRREVIGYRETAPEAVALANTVEGRWPWVTDLRAGCGNAESGEPK